MYPRKDEYISSSETIVFNNAIDAMTAEIMARTEVKVIQKVIIEYKKSSDSMKDAITRHIGLAQAIQKHIRQDLVEKENEQM